MNKQIAFLFPGQGAQYPGMGHDFFAEFAAAREVFQKADELLETPFSELIFRGSSEELTLTKNSQLAIFIVSMAILRVMQKQFPQIQPVFCAGLSLGEYTALVAADKLSFEEALFLVKKRGEWMDEACQTHPGTMQVVLGLDLLVVEEALKGIPDVWIANLNCPGQIVIAGSRNAIEKAAARLKEKGARRVMPLDVSGAFHSGLMQTAQDKLTPLINKSDLKESEIHIVMNAEGNVVHSKEAIRDCMIKQVTSPVRWQDCIEAMVKNGVELFIEMGPGKTLSGMNKRIGVNLPTISIEKVEDLENLEVNYATHG